MFFQAGSAGWEAIKLYSFDACCDGSSHVDLSVESPAQQLKRAGRLCSGAAMSQSLGSRGPRASASSSAGDVAKLIKAIFGESPIPPGLFTIDPEQDLKHEQLNELIGDLIKLDAFVTTSILEKALVLQTSLMSHHEASLVAKPLRALLQFIRTRSKNSSTGTRLPAHIRKLVVIYKEQHPNQSPTKEPEVAPAFARPPSTKPTSSASAAAAPSLLSKSKAEIEALFGIAPAQEVVALSQDSIEEVPITTRPVEVVNLLSQPEVDIPPTQEYPDQQLPAARHALEHWDAGRATLVRTSTAGQQEVGEAFAGEDGFIHVRWASGEVSATEHSSLLLALPGMRRPAAAMKRPAAKAGKRATRGWEEAPDPTQAEGPEGPEVEVEVEFEAEAEEEEPTDGEQGEEEEQAEDMEAPPPASSSSKKRKAGGNPQVPHSPFTFADGTRMKLCVFTNKSYILHKKATDTKWPQLVGCEAGMAWKYEKNHSQVITAVWCKLAELAALPNKPEVCDIREQILRS